MATNLNEILRCQTPMDERLLSPVDRAIKALSQETTATSIFAVFRGGWCGVCGIWFKEWIAIPNIAEELARLNVNLYLISRDIQKDADDAAHVRGFERGIPNIIVVGDGDLKWTAALRERWDISLKAYEESMIATPTSSAMALQPACIVHRESKVIYRWLQSQGFVSANVWLCMRI